MPSAFFASMPYDSNNDLPKDIKNTLPAKAQTTKAVESKVVSGGIAFDRESPVNEWIPVAKVGQEALLSPDNIIVTYDKDGLMSYANDTTAVGVTYNHGPERKLKNVEIDKLKFEDPYLYMQISEQIKAAIKDPTVSGCSIEGIPQKIEDGVIKEVTGTYLSLMEFPQLPACKLEEGCGVVSSSILEEVDITPTMGPETETSVSSQVEAAIEDSTKSFDIFVMNNVGVTVKIGTDTVYGSKKQLKDKEFVKTGLKKRAGYYGRDNLQFYDADTAIKIGDAIPNGSKPICAMTVVISNQEPKLVESDNRHLERETENIKLTSRGGDAEGMIKDEPIAYTGEQVKEMVASAVGEAETNLKNQQEVDSTALKDAEGKLKEKLEVKHAAELKEASELAYRKAEAITTFKAKFNPSEEVLKQAEGLDPGAIEFVVGLDIPTQERPGGVTSGSPKGEETPVERAKSIKTRFHKALGHGVTEE